MISKGDFMSIHELYEQGTSIRQIAKIMQLDRKTVTRKIRQNEYSKATRSQKPAMLLDEYKNYITDFISKIKERIPSSVILKDIIAQGYTGSLSTIQRFLTLEYKKRNFVRDPVVRFETAPGEQMQVDWTTIRHGRKPIYGFVATLGYSRYTFVWFTDNMKVETLIRCHEYAFLYFGGMSKTILYDNMKVVVILRNCYGPGLHQYNDEFANLAKRHGFIIRLCKPYRAKTKGKVERFNSYLKGNFYRPLAIKLKDAHLDITHQALNQYIHSWLIGANERIHGTTNRQPIAMFNEEKGMLLPYMNTNTAVEVTSLITMPKYLPDTRVINTNLSQYDMLLTRGVV